MSKIIQPNVGLAVVRHWNDPKLFLGVSRKDNHNDWGFPGGKLKGWIDIYDCILGELKEETGLDGRICNHVFTDSDGSYTCAAYEVDIWPETPTIFDTKESGKVAWLPKEKFFESSFEAYNRKLFQALEAIKNNP